MKTHNEFMEDVKHFNSLPAKTARALSPESDEDISMYINDSQQQNKPTGFESSSCLRREHSLRVIGTQNNSGEKSIVSPADNNQDALCELNVGGKK